MPKGGTQVAIFLGAPRILGVIIEPQVMHTGASRIEFLVNNYIYVQIIGSLGLSLGQNTSKHMCPYVYVNNRALNDRFLLLFKYLEDLGSSVRLIGSSSIDPGTVSSFLIVLVFNCSEFLWKFL